MDQFKIQGYIDFLRNTKPSAMLIEDVLEERNITLVHANSGTSKTSAWGYDLAAAMIAQEPFLGQFPILAENIYIFFISQDAPAHDVVRHSQKVFRRYFDLTSKTVRDELNRRFNVLDYEGIKFGRDSEDAGKLVESIRARLNEVMPEVPSFKDLSKEDVARAAAALERAIAHSLPPVQPDDEPISEPKVLILWDSLRKLHDGKESASDELKPVIDGLRHVNRELDATSILFHHNNRSGTMRGDASIEDAVDQSYAIRRASGYKSTDTVQYFDLHVEKPRGIPLQPFRYRMTRTDAHTEKEIIQFEYVREIGGAETDSLPESAGGRSKRPSLALTEFDQSLALAREHWKPDMSQRALTKILATRVKGGIGRSTVAKLIKTLKNESQVEAEVAAVAASNKKKVANE